MAQSSVRVTERFASTPSEKLPAPSEGLTTADVASPIEHLQQRFDEAFDRADELVELLKARQARGIDSTALQGKLQQAEADKRAALSALRKVRWMKVNPSA